MVMLLSKESVQVPILFLTIFFFCNYLTYLCRIKLIEYVQNLPLTCLDICRMLSISSTGNVILCLNEGVVIFIRSVLYVVWRDRHLRGFCKLRVASFLHDITHHSASC